MPPEEAAAAPVAAGEPAAVASETITTAPPDWIDGKFWDAEKGTPRTEELARSYREVQSLIGKRVGDLSLDSRRKLAEALPDEMRATWDTEARAKLAADPEFLTPLQEQWKAANAPQVPEAYVPSPDIVGDPDHPMLTHVAEVAKEYGLPQEAYDKLCKLGAELLAPWERPLDDAELTAAIGQDMKERSQIVSNRLATIAGNDAPGLIKLLKDAKSTPTLASAFLAVEALVNATSTKPLALDPAPASAPAPLSKQELDLMVADPRYHPGRHHDPIFRAKADLGFRKLYGETL